MKSWSAGGRDSDEAQQGGIVPRTPVSNLDRAWLEFIGLTPPPSPAEREKGVMLRTLAWDTGQSHLPPTHPLPTFPTALAEVTLLGLGWQLGLRGVVVSISMVVAPVPL